MGEGNAVGGGGGPIGSVVKGERAAFIVHVARAAGASGSDGFVLGDVEGFTGAIVQEGGEFAFPEVGGGERGHGSGGR